MNLVKSYVIRFDRDKIELNFCTDFYFIDSNEILIDSTKEMNTN